MSSTTSVTGGELVVDTLRALGVDRIFGVPGGQTLAIMDALYAQSAIAFTATRHEGAAACAADAVGRLSHRLGVCLATTGPGATNLLTGVGGAMRDSSPVLVLTCNNRLNEIARDDAQNADHVAIFRPLTKWTTLVADPLMIPRVLREAAIRATAGCPGPVHIDFARDALEARVSLEAAQSVGFGSAGDPRGGQVPASRPAADPDLVAEAVGRILAAERPVLWVGNGVQLSGAGDAVIRLAEALDLPVIVTFNALGAVPSDHPNVFGPLSRMGTVLARDAVQEADLLVAVGNSLNAVSTSRWQANLPETIIQVDVDQETIGINYPTRTLGLAGDARRVLEAMCDALEAHPDRDRNAPSRANRLAGLAAQKADWWRDVDDVDMAAAPMSPLALMRALNDETPDEACLVVDAGNPGIWTHFWRVRRPGLYLKPVGFGNMGFALPAGIAAQLLDRGRPVVALLGDGSLGMTMGELETIARERLPICIVVMNDQAYGNIRQEELHYYGDRLIGVDFVDVDYAAVARGFGITAHRADTGAALADAIRSVLASGEAGLIDARIDPDVSVWTHPLLVRPAAAQPAG